MRSLIQTTLLTVLLAGQYSNADENFYQAGGVDVQVHEHSQAKDTEANTADELAHEHYECSEKLEPISEIMGMDMTIEPLDVNVMSVEITTPLRARIDELKGFSPSVRREAYKAVEILNRMFASEEFNRAIEQYQFNGRRRFAKNLKMVNGRASKPLTNKEIYKLIHMGQEVRTAKADGTMNLRLHMVDYLTGNTVAETFLFSAPIAVNRKKYVRYNAKQIAANMMHEWLHNMGFSHSGLGGMTSHSVPYAIGNIVQKLAHKYQ